MRQSRPPEVILCDLDGVVWLAHHPVPGSVEALRRAADAGIETIFVTNNSFSTLAEQRGHLADIGIEAGDRIITSAKSAAAVLEPGGRVLVCGGPGLCEAVTDRGCEAVVAHENPGTGGPFSDVVVGLHKEFNYGVLADAMRAVRGGARLVGSNSDHSYPTPAGEVPGGGSILAAISTAANTVPLVTGKPHPPMVDLVRRMRPRVAAHRFLMVGDKPSTDGRFAEAIGCPFGFVLTGVGRAEEAPEGCLVGADLAAIVTTALGATGGP